MGGLASFRLAGRVVLEERYSMMTKSIPTELTPANILRVLEVLTESPNRLARLAAQPPERLTAPLASGERSATEMLAHLLHCEAISAGFIYLALMRNGATDQDIHPERDLGRLLKLGQFPFIELMAYFRLRRMALLRVLEALKPLQWENCLHVPGKKRAETVYWRARSLALHEAEHLDEIDVRLAKG